MRAAVVTLVPCLAAVGCLGVTQNPSYFPHLLPTGDVIRTHAKPPGFGYFRNFDPKAAKIEVTPAAASAPPRAQQVLIATVYDRDGQPRRKRRVEWIVDGPGSIIEVDESGIFPGRGYKVDNKYAVSYTDYFGHCIDRGNDDPRDDFTVRPGQTWCVISSPVEGQTTVTAYAPEVFDWDAGRAFVTVTWGAAAFRFPPPTAARSDGGADPSPPADDAPRVSLDVALPAAVALDRDARAAITLANAGRADSPAATVRAVVPDGAEFVSADPAPTRRAGRDLSWDLGPVAGGGKRDVTLVVRPTRRGELALAVAAETAGGLRADKRVSTRVDVAGLKVAADAPPAAVGGPAAVRVRVTNTGAVPLDGATAWVTAGSGLRHASGADPVEVAVGPVAPGQTATAEVVFAAEKAGTFPVRVNVVAAGGPADRADATVAVTRAELKLAVTGPDAVPVGQEGLFEVRVTNAGDAPVRDVAVRAEVPAGLRISSPPSLLGKGAGGLGESNPSPGPSPKKGGGQEVTWELDALNPNETKVVRLTVAGEAAADRGTVSVTADGSGLSATASAPVAVVGTPVLVMELADPPGPVPVGGRATYRVTVRNRGTGPARRVEVTADLSGGLTPVRGTGPDRPAAIDGGRVTFPPVAELPPGSTAAFVVEADGSSPGPGRVAVRVAAQGLSTPLQEEQATRVVRR